ncbi:MAG: sensor histidine kinase [Helicobacteraceae bacterium]|nr:sensor histidine kinase [Helicobacteraceae bacterium]
MYAKRSLSPEFKHRIRWLSEAFIVAVIFYFFSYLLYLQERDRIRGAQERLISVYTVYAELMFADVDDMTYRAADSYFGAGGPSTTFLYRVWQGRQNDDSLIHNALMLDRDKKVLFQTKDVDLNLEKIDLITSMPPSAKGAYLTPPLKCGSHNEWIIVLTRVFYEKDGAVAGYALTTFNVGVISQRFSKLTSVGKNTISLVSRRRGAVIARAPENEAVYGKVSMAYDAFLKGGENFDTLMTVFTLEGEKSMASFMPLESYDMMVVCTTPYSELYDRLRPFYICFFIVWLIVSVAILRISRVMLIKEKDTVSEKRALWNKAEEALRKQLEAEKSKNEHERLLIQQSKMAAMGEMIGAIAHQWRQPLNSIGLYVQDILDAYRYGTLDMAYLESAVENTVMQLKFMSSTINDFSSFFKPDKEKAVFDISKITRSALTIASAQMRKHDIDVIFEVPDEPIFCNGYENELGQAILNLIGNAKDAVTENRKKDRYIIIRLSRTERGARLEVEDNGGGIPDDLLNRVFEPYFTTKEPPKGTGIGLYMSKMIVEDNMGGKIGVYNVRYGVCFFIELSVAERRADDFLV